jgi:hypothetical protein
MRRTLAFVVFLLVSLGALAQAQSSNPQVAGQELTPQVLGEMLRTATTFHDLVTKMNLSKSFGPDQHVLGADGQYHHPLERTAEAIGAGAGAGAAIGGMMRTQNGVLIGAIIGSAGGLIVDQIMRHREEARPKASADPGPDVLPDPRQLQHR